VTPGSSAEPKGWARVWATAHPFARPMPRAGAWYPVVGDASGERAVIEVRGKRVAILKQLVEIRPDRPKVFTVVVRTRNAAAKAPGGAGPKLERIYAVCPECTQRVQVKANQPAVSCPKCFHTAEVAWWETG
jgi:hypothetical protein